MILNHCFDFSKIFGQVYFYDDVKKLTSLLGINDLDRVNELRVCDLVTLLVFDQRKSYLNLLHKLSVFILASSTC